MQAPRAIKLDARAAAQKLLHAVLIEKRMLTEAASHLDIEGPEAARAQRLASTTLRYLSKIDALLKPHLERAPALRVQMILRLAVAELMIDKAADHGVVNSAVRAAKAVPKTAKQAGLVNAVLRKIALEQDTWDTLPNPTLPIWMRKQVAKAYGRDRLEAIEEAHLKPVPLDLTLKEKRPDELDGEMLPTGSLRRSAQGQVTALSGFEEGAFWVQDAAASMPVRALGDVKGLRVLDLCAAPGGKTMQLAAAGAQVTALDISYGRLLRLRENLKRTKLTAQTVTADALEWEPDEPFDIILLDAPCSATGTIRRHPDLPYLRQKQDVEALTELQYQLLDRAIWWLKPQGKLLYCTCSLLPVEGEFQIKAALKRQPDLELLDLDAAKLGLPEICNVPTGLRLLPDLWQERGGMDGFFISLLQKR